MKIVIATAYKSYEKELKGFIENFRASGNTIYGGDRNTLKTFSLDGKTITIKAFRTPNFVNRIVYNYFRDSKAKRSFTHAQKLLELGIGTPSPIAFMENSNAISFLDSYYICEHIDYDLTYRELVHEPDFHNHEEILRAFTRFTFKMHEVGILFKDHSPGNTLICKAIDGYEFYLVDLNRMNFKKLSFHERMENMKRLTPKKEMVAVMANEYAKLSGEDELKIFNTLWALTSHFQMKYHRKRKMKNTLYFWRAPK